MNRFLSLVGYVLEVTLLGLLLFQCIEMFDLTGTKALAYLSAFALLYSPCFYLQWKELRERSLPKATLVRLCALTGLCIFLSFALTLGITFQLKAGVTKELRQEVITHGVLREFAEPWYNHRFEGMRSEGMLYAMLFASMCLLYGSRCASGTIAPPKTDPPPGA